MQVVSELQARSVGSVLPHQEACNVLWGLAALDQLTRPNLEQLVARLTASGVADNLSKAEAMQLRQVLSIALFSLSGACSTDQYAKRCIVSQSFKVFLGLLCWMDPVLLQKRWQHTSKLELGLCHCVL